MIENLSKRFFKYGMFLIPFENLSIAPSAGWPAIAPIFFFVSFLCLPKREHFTASSLIWGGALAIISFTGYILAEQITNGNRFFYRDVIAAAGVFFLGYTFYRTMIFHLVRNDVVDVSFIGSLLRSLIRGSFVALSISLMILIFNNLFKVSGFIQIASLVLKRNVESERFQFLFAEPSFISVHILGVLVPFYWLSVKFNLLTESKRLIKIIIIYIVISIIFANSTRFLIDLFVLGVLTFFSYFLNSSSRLNYKKVFLLLIIPVLLFAFFVSNLELLETLTNNRVSFSGDFSSLVNSDPSLASRFFRIDAVYQGILDHKYLLLTGVGLGNIGSLIDFGYIKALDNFYSFYLNEVESIGLIGNGPNMFNMHVRLIGEFGLLFYGFILWFFFNRKIAFLYFLTFWCYVQFDSYAFYAFWIYCAASRLVGGFDGHKKHSNLHIQKY